MLREILRRLVLHCWGQDALIEAVRRQEREECVRLIRTLAQRWGQSESDTLRALLDEVLKRG